MILGGELVLSTTFPGFQFAPFHSLSGGTTLDLILSWLYLRAGRHPEMSVVGFEWMDD
jgi:hypothetical protein